jgi:WD40 repeat protein
VRGVEGEGIRMWDSLTGRVVPPFLEDPSVSWTTPVIFSPDGTMIFSSSIEDNSILIWDWQNKTIITRLEGHSKPVVSLGYSPDKKKLISGKQTINI